MAAIAGSGHVDELVLGKTFIELGGGWVGGITWPVNIVFAE